MALLGILPGALFADSIYLKNGKILTGTITGKTADSVTIEMADSWKEIPRAQVKKITSDGADAGPQYAPAQEYAPASRSAPGGSKPLRQARSMVLSGDYSGAVAAYNPLALNTQGAVPAAEYAYALALAGQRDLALAHLDRAFLADPSSPEVLFYASAVFGALGMQVVAKELHREPPAWLAAGPPKMAALALPSGKYQDLFDGANLLLSQLRLASTAARFASIVRAYPAAQLPWAGYAISLEKLGAFKAAARAVERDIELGAKEVPETLTLLEEHKAELEARPPVTYSPPPNPNENLKGRYLFFFGLNRVHTETEDSVTGYTIKNDVTTLQTRVGLFLTNRFDLGATVGSTSGYENKDNNGMSYGISGRYSQPMFRSKSFNGTAGLRLEHQLAGQKGKNDIVLSPGFSYVLASGSLDLYLDYPLTGQYKDIRTLSLGYTVYFGGSRK